MKSILVTGGFGFIGTHLVEALLSDPNNQVHVVDDLSTSPVNVPSYVAQLPDSTRLSYDLCTICKYFGHAVPHFDEVYHLACVVGPVMLLEKGGEILRGIVNDTYNIVDYCVKEKARLLDFSTGEVYGGGVNGVCAEVGAMIVSPKASARLEYAVGKLACEIATKNLCRVGKLHSTIIRPFNATGPRQQVWGGFVLPRFISQAFAGEPLTVYWDGKGVRSFTHVKDIANGSILMMANGRSGEAYNIGNPANKVTILHLANRVIELIGSKSKVSFVDPRTLWGPLFEECADKYPDVERAICELGWQPTRLLDQIITDSAVYTAAGRAD